VNNTARSFPGAPADVAAQGLYIEDLAARRAEIGGSSYVIAELDGAYTKYDEGTVESEWRGDRVFLRGSYTWSKYYGNFDQDNTTAANDANIFIGSSFIGDGIGRQLWNFRDGRLRGDRPHLLKLYGFYTLPWKAMAGGFFVAQSGQPWEAWDRLAYPGGDSSDSGKYVEPAGSRRSDPHYQLDLKYTQDFQIRGRWVFQFVADVYNIFDKQTGYNINPVRTSTSFGAPRNFYDPRLLQLSFRIRF
jgi:hypothetical protein